MSAYRTPADPVVDPILFRNRLAALLGKRGMAVLHALGILAFAAPCVFMVVGLVGPPAWMGRLAFATFGLMTVGVICGVGVQVIQLGWRGYCDQDG